MLEFLLLWFWCLLALAVAAGGLWLVYNLMDTDLGLSGIWREAIIVVILSALQAAVIIGISALVGEPSRRSGRAIWICLVGLTYITYKLSHLQEMEDQKIGILVATDSAILFLIRLYSHL